MEPIRAVLVAEILSAALAIQYAAEVPKSLMQAWMGFAPRAALICSASWAQPSTTPPGESMDSTTALTDRSLSAASSWVATS